ncbi:hypothetical protein [Lysobacter capsici]|uniref:hypothetical protein n=1 Tax=Lysobacter capsici TaxID=435897 RepID=UPI001BFFE445|nr:hypothetical protein [Lysobacter capsici]QWF17817.1 hypothetical protein KME82_03235 [Lysobacter capsici]
MNSKLRFEAFGDDSGVELHVFFENADFKGVSAAWFSRDQILAFVKDVSRFPLSLESPPLLVGGYWDDLGRHIDQEHVRLFVTPFGAQGGVELGIILAVPHEDSRRGLKCSLAVTVKSEYAQLSSLGAGLNNFVLNANGVFELVFPPE